MDTSNSSAQGRNDMDQAAGHGVIDAVAPFGAVAAVLNILTALHPLVTVVSVVYMLVYIYDRYVYHRQLKLRRGAEE